MRIILLFLCCALMSYDCVSQTARSSGTVNAILKEKLRLRPEVLRQAMAAGSIAERRRIIENGLREAESLSTKPELQPQSLLNDNISQSDAPESEIHAAINPTDTNNLVCSAMSTNGLSLSFPMYYTHDGGKSWLLSNFAPAPSSDIALVLGGGDPMFAFDADGKLYYSWINLFTDLSSSTFPMNMYWVSSLNGGETWDRSVTNDTISSGFYDLSSVDNSVIPDKQWMVCDQSQSSGRNNLYCSMLQTYGLDQRVAMRVKGASELVFRSTLLRPTASDYTFNQFTSIDCDDQGIVHMSFVGAFASDSLPEGEFRIFHMSSSDAGASVHKETLVTPLRFLKSRSGDPNVISPPTGMSRIQCLPQIACDKYASSAYKGNIYIVWTALGVNTREKNGLDIYFCRSTDHGQTWSSPIVVNDDPRGQSVTQAYASICVNTDGVIVATWYDFRDDSTGHKVNYMMSYSFDGGRTFIKNFPVTTASSDFSLFVSDTTKSFGMGEYNQVVATRGYAIPFWGDVRSGQRQIYCAKVPINANPLGDVRPQSISAIGEGWSMEAPRYNGASADVQVDCDHDIDLRMYVVDIRGNAVQKLFEGRMAAGQHSLNVDLNSLATDRYYIVATTSHARIVQSLVNIR